MSRLTAFLIAVVAWYAIFLTVGVIVGSSFSNGQLLEALGVGILVGSMYGIPVLVYAASADGLAAVCFPNRPALGFLLFAVVGILGLVACVLLGPGATDSTRQAWEITLLGLSSPTLVVITIYTIANAVRKSRHDVAGRSTPSSTAA